MPILMLALFIAVPVIEIALFIEIGGWIGLWPTIAIVIATAFAGTTLLRIQGFAVLQRAQEAAARNELPVAEVFDGLCLLVAGVLLLTPGFFTDTLGFLLFVPPLRRGGGLALWRWLVRSGKVSVHGTSFRTGPGGPGQGPRPPPGGPGDGTGPVIDGDYEEVDTPPPDRRKGDGRDRLGPREGGDGGDRG